MSIDWRVKAALQQAFSRIPAGAKLNFLMQTKVTKSLPAPEDDFDEMLDSAKRHLAAARQVLGETPPAEIRAFEFGAGWHIGVAVSLGGLGVGNQTLVDRYPLASEELVRITIDRMAKRIPTSDRLSTAMSTPQLRDALGELGIEYLAPVDARRTSLPEGSFELVTSTSTLEHIPRDELAPLLAECFRLLRPGGAFSALIDYKDHYASFDTSISPLNFLKYSPRRWRLYSPLLQFQNRLRHSDHVAAIEAAGFELVSVDTVDGTADDEAFLATTTIDDSFAGYEKADLAIRDSHVVAVKPLG